MTTTNVSANQLLINRRQRGNPMLKHLRNVPSAVVEGIVPDFVVGAQACALFLSVRYHLLHPKYVVRRLRELGRTFRLRVLLCLVDVTDNEKPLCELNKLALLHDCTLLLAWSTLEAARYLETLKAYENKPADTILGKVDDDYLSVLGHAITKVRSINKTDAQTLATTFGSLQGILRANEAELLACPGLGSKKVRRLLAVLDQPLLDDAAMQAAEEEEKKSASAKGAESPHVPVGEDRGEADGDVSEQKAEDRGQEQDSKAGDKGQPEQRQASHERQAERQAENEAELATMVDEEIEILEAAAPNGQ